MQQQKQACCGFQAVRREHPAVINPLAMMQQVFSLNPILGINHGGAALGASSRADKYLYIWSWQRRPTSWVTWHGIGPWGE